jgi:hypothetical protein
MKAEIEIYSTEIIYRVGYEDADYEDEFDVKQINEDGKVKWKIESVIYGAITNSSAIGKKLLKHIQKEVTSKDKDTNYWKQNAEEDYATTPISVLRYISELEKQLKSAYTEERVKDLLLAQRGNSYVAVLTKCRNEEIATAAAAAPEPWNWDNTGK